MRVTSILLAIIIIFALAGCGEQKVIPNYRTVERNGKKYEVNSEEPFTGKIVEYYSMISQQKEFETEYREGIPHGKITVWRSNGQKASVGEYHNGKRTWKKCWDVAGNLIDCNEIWAE